jgi:hypothetical protein
VGQWPPAQTCSEFVARLAPMAQIVDGNLPGRRIDLVDDPIITHPDPIQVLGAGELDRTARKGIRRELVYGGQDAR